MQYWWLTRLDDGIVLGIRFACCELNIACSAISMTMGTVG